MPELATQLREYLDATAPPVELEEIFSTPVGELPVRPLRPRRPRRPIPAWAYALAAAVVVLLLIGGAAWLVRANRQVEPAEPTVTTAVPTTTLPGTTTAPPPTVPPPDTPEEPEISLDDIGPAVVLAEEVTSSALGDIRWRVIEGGPLSILDNWVGTPTGLVALDPAGGGLVASADGVEWSRVPSPVPGTVTLVAFWKDHGVYRLSSEAEDGTNQEWESADFVTWVPITVPEAVVPSVQGIGVHAHAEPRNSVRVSGLTLATWSGGFHVDWSLIAGLVDPDLQLRLAQEPRGLRPEWNPASGTLDLLLDSSGEVVARLELIISGSNDGWIVQVVNADSGETVGSIDGSLPDLALEEVLDTIVHGWESEPVFLLSDGDGVDLVEPDWLGAVDEPSPPGLVLGAVDGNFLAYVLVGDFGEGGGDPGATQIWRSSDGRSWELIGPAPWSSSQESDVVFAERDGVAMIGIWDSGQDVYTTLRSEDGINWAAPSRPLVATGESFSSNAHEVYPIESGWVKGGDGTDPDLPLWVSLDGDIWEEVELPDLPIPTGGGDGDVPTGNSIIYRFGEAVVVIQIEP